MSASTDTAASVDRKTCVAARVTTGAAARNASDASVTWATAVAASYGVNTADGVCARAAGVSAARVTAARVGAGNPIGAAPVSAARRMLATARAFALVTGNSHVTGKPHVIGAARFLIDVRSSASARRVATGATGSRVNATALSAVVRGVRVIGVRVRDVTARTEDENDAGETN